MWHDEAGRQAYNGTITLPDSADVHQQHPFNRSRLQINSSGSGGINVGTISRTSLSSSYPARLKVQDSTEIEFEDGFKITGKELGDLLKAVKGDYPEVFI